MRPLSRNWKPLLPYVLAALVETAAAMPWLMLLYSTADRARWTDGLPGGWLPLLTFLVAAAWEAGSPKQEAEASGRSRVIAMGGGVIGTYLLAYAALPASMRPGSLLHSNLALAYIPVACYLWYRGVKSAAERLEYYRVYSHFLWQAAGLVIGLVLLLIAGIARDSRILLTLFWSAVLLFAAGLVLLVVTREQNLKSGQKAIGQETGSGSPLSSWLSVVVLGLTGLTLVLSQALSLARLTVWGRAARNLLDRPLGWLVDVCMLLIYRMLMLVWLVIQPIYDWVVAHRRPLPPQEAQQGLPQELPELVNAKAMVNAERYVPFLKALLVLAAVVLLVVLLYRRYAMLRREEADEEERINLGFWSNLLADERALFRRSRRRSGPAGAGDAALAADPLDPRWLFRRLQAYGERIGRPRGTAETPNAFRDKLAAGEPEALPAAAAVVSAYNQARYGSAPPAPSAVTEAAARLEVLANGVGSEGETTAPSKR